MSTSGWITTLHPSTRNGLDSSSDEPLRHSGDVLEPVEVGEHHDELVVHGARREV